MMTNDLTKRIITSIPLILLLGLSLYNLYVLIFSLFIVSFISCIEFQNLILKIFKKKTSFERFYKLIINMLFLFYLVLFSVIIFFSISHNAKVNILYIFMICIFSDIGGLVFGRIFKGKKLTKISPNKTFSGAIGSFILSLSLVPLFYFISNNEFTNLFNLILFTIYVSFFCQLGDLFISFLKRKARVKDTGNILPGHGGLLDRIDGMLFAVPIGVIISRVLL